jgi:ribosomal protein S18 acetylase RimI-like enzyme
MLSIIEAESPQHIAIIRELMLEYAQWLEFNLCFQGFEEELRTLPGKYSPPNGRLLLALWEGKIAGMGALRPMPEPDICEMKRLYVRREFRGHSLGRALAERLIAEAGNIGYRKMCLDTVPGKMDDAIALYRRLGFKTIAPYYSSPVERTLFMELDLTSSSESERAS